MGASGTELRGSVAVITGASAGIGAASARRLAARGMELVLGARRVERMAALAEELREACGVPVSVCALDVRDAESCDAFHAAALQVAGSRGIQVLLNNAGLALGNAPVGGATRADEDGWEVVVDTNVMGLLRITRRFLPDMAAGKGGTVVHLGSLAGIQAYEGGVVYCATKAAVRAATKAMRLEGLGLGVRLCCLNPGMVETDFSVIRFGGDQGAADACYAGMTPLTADDIAAAVEWVVTLPAHMNIEEMTIQPLDQAAVGKVARPLA